MHDSEDRNNLTGSPGITWLLLVAAVLSASVAYASRQHWRPTLDSTKVVALDAETNSP
jgi:hypothetical protein